LWRKTTAKGKHHFKARNGFLALEHCPNTGQKGLCPYRSYKSRGGALRERVKKMNIKDI
jgi:hypothetical protein